MADYHAAKALLERLGFMARMQGTKGVYYIRPDGSGDEDVVLLHRDGTMEAVV